MSEKSSSECGNELPKGLPLGRGKPTFEEECTERIKTATKNSQDEQWAYFLRGMSYFNADIQHLNEPNNHNTYVAQAIDDYAKSYENKFGYFFTSLDYLFCLSGQLHFSR